MSHVSNDEIYEYIYTRRRFNTDLIFYASIMIIILLVRGFYFSTDETFANSIYDLTSLSIFFGFLGLAIKTAVTLKRSRKVGQVNTHTGEINIVPLLSDPSDTK